MESSVEFADVPLWSPFCWFEARTAEKLAALSSLQMSEGGGGMVNWAISSSMSSSKKSGVSPVLDGWSRTRTG